MPTSEEKDCQSQAKDFTQGFFLHLLERNLIKQADRDKGASVRSSWLA